MRRGLGLKRPTTFLALAAAITLAAAGCASKPDDSTSSASGSDKGSCKIAIDNGSGTGFPFPNAGAQGIEEAAKSLGCTIIANLDGKNDVQTEAANVQNIIAQKPDGVVMIPANAAEAAKFVDQFSAAGIKVVSYHSIIGADRKIDDVYPKLSALVIENETGAGEQTGQAMLKALPNGGNVAVIIGAPGYAENTLRVEKFKTATAGKFTIVAEQPGGWVADQGQSACASILNAHPDLVGIYAISDDMGVGCQKAVAAAKSKALVFGVGGSKLGVEAIKTGGLTGTICYKPVDGGKKAAEELKKAIDDENYGTAKLVFYDTPSIDKSNVADCDPQW
ncbi:sugar ABC transporter substrate-binding protein [Cryptosporangium phraense]|uniref:Sugar ABC transporter substrate-binding protein n=1 Tax=Cryptosporangium phraense TaxID=2593070 RepID=A0A545AHM2_9ACTN|nr:sugar ABC transporter substrate-binding protein [Cryptosporangium phraense]TQS40808.1 sugar ABC transporter substrate-binding protein [Cryptosporangium phraense]